VRAAEHAHAAAIAADPEVMAAEQELAAARARAAGRLAMSSAMRGALGNSIRVAGPEPGGEVAELNARLRGEQAEPPPPPALRPTATLPGGRRPAGDGEAGAGADPTAGGTAAA
jgi:hypothetical protein